MHGLAPVTLSPWVERMTRKWIRRILLGGLIAGSAAGCSRMHYRERADKDVAGVITQKNIFPEWKVENWHVYPDPRARHANPGCPDHPPYPPDDQAAWMLSPNPQKPHKKWGSGRYEGTEYLRVIEGWDAQNRAEDDAVKPETPSVIPASYREPLSSKSDGPRAGDKLPAGIEPEPISLPVALPAQSAGDAPKPAAKDLAKQDSAKMGSRQMGAAASAAAGYLFAFKSDQQTYRLRLDQAVELGLFNSREFQDRREDLYLAALPVTTERFSFAAQALATENIVREVLGRERAGGPANRWNIGTDVSVSRLLPTGAQLLIRLANQVVLDMSSGRPDISVSNFSLTFVQPLLRGGGFAVTLEALTQAERTLLYAIRSYARFRKVFYVVIAGQGDYTNNPYGLQGLSVNLGRAIGNNLTAPTAGYLPIVLRSANLANERRNITSLDQLVRLYQNLKEGGVVSDLQAVRVELQLLNSQARLLDSNRQYLDNLDTFKLQLGVPTNLPIELDDTPVRPIRTQLERFDQLYKDLADFQTTAGKYNAADTLPQIRGRWVQLLTESPLARGTPFARDYPRLAAELSQLTQEQLQQRINDLTSKRQKLLDLRAERQLAGIAETEANLLELLSVEVDIDLARFEAAMRIYGDRPWLKELPERRASEQMNLYREIVDSGLLVALQARNQRLENIRDTWPELPPIQVEDTDILRAPLDEGYTKVAQVALLNRLDLMNARAQLVDAYRQITIRANALLGQFDVRYDLATASPANNNVPFALGGSRARNAVSLNIQPPFVRRVERNNYRAALISYQRQRRTLMAFEDNIINDVRRDIRQLRALAEQYNVQKRSVELAYSQLDNARSTLLAPPDPRVPDSAGTAASLTEQLLNAQQNLLTSQNQLYTAWVTYLTARMNLYLDLEQLPLDARGIWIDDQPRISPTRPTDPGVERIAAPRPVDAGK